MQKLINIKNAAQLLGISRSLVYTLVDKKQIPHIRISKRILFNQEQLDHFVTEHAIEPVEKNERK